MLRLTLAFALLLAACGCAAGEQASSLGPASTSSPAPAASLLLTPTPPPPRLELSASQARQGTVVLAVAVPAPEGLVAVELGGRRYLTVREGNAVLAYLPVPLDQHLGTYQVTLLENGRAVDQRPLEVVDGGYPREQLFLPPATASLLADVAAVQEEQRLLAVAYGSFTAQRLWQGAWHMPVDGPISDPFGVRRSINGGPYTPHTGTDLAVAEGTPVLAPAGGRVVLARELHLRGLSVVVDHGAGVISGYHHLSEVSVQEGQTVQAGQELGKVGSTGLAGGPHLHWEVVVSGVRVDPMAWLQSISGP